MKSLFAFLHQLRDWVTGFNAIQERFDILQSKLDAISISLENVAASAKNLEEVAKGQHSTEQLKRLVGQITNTNSGSSGLSVLRSKNE
ncbi:MAG: hypothetical protein JZU65_21250 [Chlorobium sp.]|nr:hypothetical protein [Chlorobium sp.]